MAEQPVALANIYFYEVKAAEKRLELTVLKAKFWNWLDKLCDSNVERYTICEGITTQIPSTPFNEAQYHEFRQFQADIKDLRIVHNELQSKANFDVGKSFRQDHQL